MFCVYCGEEKPDSERSKEHVLPKAVGGSLEPQNPFKLKNVCRICNSRAGLYVDGPFIRSWFVSNTRFQNALRYSDLSKNPILPLAYVGEMNNSPLESKTCDIWRGPSDDTIYHFHEPYPDEPDSQIAVGSIRKEKIDPGFAFIFVRATNPFWHPLILRAILNHDSFEGTILYSGNLDNRPLLKKLGIEEVPSELKSVHEKLLNLSGKPFDVGGVVYKNYDKRFLAKLGLGFGALILNESFKQSPDADRLRVIMWTRSSSDLTHMEDRVISTLSGKLQELKSRAKWSAGHMIAILPDDENILNLFAIFYGELNAAVRVSYDQSHWEGKVNHEGLVFVVAPGLRRFAGPVTVDEYVEAKKGHFNERTEELAELFEYIDRLPPLPSFDADNS